MYPSVHHNRTSRIDSRRRDRWERKSFGGAPKRSGRFTKPGKRPRAKQQTQRKTAPADTDAVSDDGRLGAVARYLRQSYTSGSLQTNPLLNGIFDNTTTAPTNPAIYTLPDTSISWAIPGRSSTDATTNGNGDIMYTINADASGSTDIDALITAPHIQRIYHSDVSGFSPERIKRQWKEIEQENRRLRFREQLRDQLAPAIIRRHAHAADFSRVSAPEAMALTLLKSLVTPDQWRHYLKNGFLAVRGASGLLYQIIRGRDHIRVFRRGLKIAELCIHLPHTCPPTDHVVAKKMMIEADEMSVWRGSNNYMSSGFHEHRGQLERLVSLVDERYRPTRRDAALTR